MRPFAQIIAFVGRVIDLCVPGNASILMVTFVIFVPRIAGMHTRCPEIS